MSNQLPEHQDLPGKADPARSVPPGTKRRARWYVTGAAGLAGVASLAAVAGMSGVPGVAGVTGAVGLPSMRSTTNLHASAAQLWVTTCGSGGVVAMVLAVMTMVVRILGVGGPSGIRTPSRWGVIRMS